MVSDQKNDSPANLLPECPVTFLDFQRLFADEKACILYLEKMRWPRAQQESCFFKTSYDKFTLPIFLPD